MRWLVLGLFIPAPFGFGQLSEIKKATILGKVVECSTRRPLPLASYAVIDDKGRKVILTKEARHHNPYNSVTDRGGNYRVDNLLPGSVTLYFSHVGYHSEPILENQYAPKVFQRIVRLDAGETLTLDLCLQANQVEQ